MSSGNFKKPARIACVSSGAAAFLGRPRVLKSIMRNLLRQIAHNLRAGGIVYPKHKQSRCCRWAARGIEAESPQELHWQFRGLAAESPVFCPWFPRAKNAPKGFSYGTDKYLPSAVV
jgi:hypothetical protein